MLRSAKRKQNQIYYGVATIAWFRNFTKSLCYKNLRGLACPMMGV